MPSIQEAYINLYDIIAKKKKKIFFDEHFSTPFQLAPLNSTPAQPTHPDLHHTSHCPSRRPRLNARPPYHIPTKRHNHHRFTKF
jgi:hypothetical protein